jgi:EpsI family protein
MGNWEGQEQPLPERIVQAVGVSDYTNRVYFQPTDPPVQLYIGYYASQRTGDTIHSPKNCLPGVGWEPISAGYATIALTSARQIVVNDYIIQKDLNKQMVLYWYQGRGRVIASEYARKFWMVTDAISRNRTDGALVRLVTPMDDGEELCLTSNRIDEASKLDNQLMKQAPKDIIANVNHGRPSGTTAARQKGQPPATACVERIFASSTILDHLD